MQISQKEIPLSDRDPPPEERIAALEAENSDLQAAVDLLVVVVLEG